jgi:hypothetical protein
VGIYSKLLKAASYFMQEGESLLIGVIDER